MNFILNLIGKNSKCVEMHNSSFQKKFSTFSILSFLVNLKFNVKIYMKQSNFQNIMVKQVSDSFPLRQTRSDPEIIWGDISIALHMNL